MSGCVNKVILIGNVGGEPERRNTASGGSMVTFSLATNQTWRDRATGERRERVEWHRIAIFNERLAEVATKYVRKGTKLYIEGQLQTRKWTDQGGTERTVTEVVLAAFNGELVMVGGKPSDERTGGEPPEPRSAAPSRGRDDVDDEIPF